MPSGELEQRLGHCASSSGEFGEFGDLRPIFPASADFSQVVGCTACDDIERSAVVVAGASTFPIQEL